MRKQITLRLKEEPSIPVEAENINPLSLTGKSLAEISCLPVWNGNRQQRLGDYFDIDIMETEEHDEGLSLQENLKKIMIEGDLTRFKRLGQGMTTGEMEIRGSVGFHTGALMRGGILRIKGNAADWLGAHMEGGQIVVEGSAGHYVGAAYRGKTQGMTGGTILIHGNAGQMAGSRMRRGLIGVGGNCGDAAGFKMLAGTVIVAGTCGVRAGANMRRGTLILLQPTELLPSFYGNCCYRPVFWGLLIQELQQKGYHVCDPYRNGVFRRYSGDANEGGKGEILICQSN